jgi:hypothetical protein
VENAVIGWEIVLAIARRLSIFKSGAARIRRRANADAPAQDRLMLKLSSQQFATIFESLRSASASIGSEQRVTTRMEVQTAVKLATLEQGKIARCFSGLTRDVSTCGVGLFQYAPAESGSQFLIGFPYNKSELILSCSVRFCKPMAEGLFGIGAQFESLASKELVEALKLARQGAIDRIKSSILS